MAQFVAIFARVRDCLFPSTKVRVISNDQAAKYTGYAVREETSGHNLSARGCSDALCGRTHGPAIGFWKFRRASRLSRGYLQAVRFSHAGPALSPPKTRVSQEIRCLAFTGNQGELYLDSG